MGRGLRQNHNDPTRSDLIQPSPTQGTRSPTGTEVTVLPAHIRRDRCPSTHSVPTENGWTRGADEAIEQLICSDGREQFKMRCRVCQTAGGPISPTTLNSWGLNRGHIEIVRDLEPRDYPPCSYRGCTVAPTEYHHFSPRNTFPDADNWPCLPLCRDHHVQWHRAMDGYRWHRKAAA